MPSTISRMRDFSLHAIGRHGTEAQSI